MFDIAIRTDWSCVGVWQLCGRFGTVNPSGASTCLFLYCVSFILGTKLAIVYSFV